MKVVKGVDEFGNKFREMIESNYDSIKQLQEDYSKRGYKTWLSPYDSEKWVLTVRQVAIYG